MNVREEDRQKNNCPSRGLGLAAAAIGVGVGAALYYFFSKRPEHPDQEGSTASGWTCEQPHALEQCHENEDSYTTISENSTSDTSMYDSDSNSSESSEESEHINEGSNTPNSFRYLINLFDVDASDISGDTFDDFFSDGFDASLSSDSMDTTSSVDVPTFELSQRNFNLIETARSFSLSSDSMDWDITTSSVDVPTFEFSQRNFTLIETARSFMSVQNEESQSRAHALYEEEQIKILREEAYRERSWSLEECSICFDIILKDQQVTTLPCTHHFHSACITPWLQEQQTCPNCRKAAE